MNNNIALSTDNQPTIGTFLSWTTTILLACLLTFSALAQEKTSTPLHFGDLQITVVGEGRDLVFIPGLNSGAAAFSEVCAAFANRYRCHLLQLPGFAGAPPIENVAEGFLPVMTNQITAYIKDNDLGRPVLVGHSLGGFTALTIAAQQPNLIDTLVIVDSLPYLPAVQNPAATPDQMQPIAENMRRGFTSMSDAQFARNLPMQLMGMTRAQGKMPVLTEWSKTSDRATMAQAMYEMQTTDLRNDIKTITAPTLVMGAWAAYESYGTTKENSKQMYQAQYRNLGNKEIYMSDGSYHFIMWDDLDWLLDKMNNFLSSNEK